jgi:hypothetical protein
MQAFFRDLFRGQLYGSDEGPAIAMIGLFERKFRATTRVLGRLSLSKGLCFSANGAGFIGSPRQRPGKIVRPKSSAEGAIHS